MALLFLPQFPAYVYSVVYVQFPYTVTLSGPRLIRLNMVFPKSVVYCPVPTGIGQFAESSLEFLGFVSLECLENALQVKEVWREPQLLQSSTSVPQR